MPAWESASKISSVEWLSLCLAPHFVSSIFVFRVLSGSHYSHITDVRTNSPPLSFAYEVDTRMGLQRTTGDRAPPPCTVRVNNINLCAHKRQIPLILQFTQHHPTNHELNIYKMPKGRMCELFDDDWRTAYWPGFERNAPFCTYLYVWHGTHRTGRLAVYFRGMRPLWKPLYILVIDNCYLCGTIERIGIFAIDAHTIGNRGFKFNRWILKSPIRHVNIDFNYEVSVYDDG